MNLLTIFTVWFCAGLLIAGTASHLMQAAMMRAPSQDVLLAAQIQIGVQRTFAPIKAPEMVWTSK